MSRKPSRSPKRRLAASHQRSWLWGHHAVLETLLGGRWPIDELFVADTLPPQTLEQALAAARVQGISVIHSTADRMQQLCGHEDHQGLLARMQSYPFQSVPGATEIRQRIHDADRNGTLCPLFVCLDRLQDPHNFGAILRSCDAVQAAGVIVGSSQQAAVTPHVARASSGAVNHLDIMQTGSLLQTVMEFRSAGCTAVAATEKASQNLWSSSLNRPTLLVIGTEATGIAPALLKLCDLHVSIPMLGQVGSLNAAVAAGILLFECRRQSLSSAPGSAKD